MVIRAKGGTKINLAAERQELELAVHNWINPELVEQAKRRIAIIDALVAALSEHSTGFPVDRHTMEYVAGWNARGKAVRQAAGVVERSDE